MAGRLEVDDSSELFQLKSFHDFMMLCVTYLKVSSVKKQNAANWKFIQVII